MKNYSIAKRTVALTVGESVKIVRELQELSQNALAALTGIPQSTISGIENDKAHLCFTFLRFNVQSLRFVR